MLTGNDDRERLVPARARRVEVRLFPGASYKDAPRSNYRGGGSRNTPPKTTQWFWVPVPSPACYEIRRDSSYDNDSEEDDVAGYCVRGRG